MMSLASSTGVISLYRGMSAGMLTTEAAAKRADMVVLTVVTEMSSLSTLACRACSCWYSTALELTVAVA